MTERYDKTLIAVADGAKLLLFENKLDDATPQLQLVAEDAQENPPTRDLGSDRPGRFADASGQARSAVANTDWHDQAEHRFAKDAAKQIEIAFRDGHYRRLVLIAPPRALHDLREALHKDVARSVVASLDKDLTHHTVQAIENAVRDAMQHKPSG